MRHLLYLTTTTTQPCFLPFLHPYPPSLRIRDSFYRCVHVLHEFIGRVLPRTGMRPCSCREWRMKWNRLKGEGKRRKRRRILLHAAGFPRSALKCNVEKEEEEKEEGSRKGEGFRDGGGANDSAIRYREGKFRFSRLYVALLFPRYQGRERGISRLCRNSIEIRNRLALPLPLPPPLPFLPLLLFFSASESVVIRGINPRRGGRGSSTQTSRRLFSPLWLGGERNAKGKISRMK